MAIRVLQVGLGPIGASIARQVMERAGFELVGGVDLDPAKGREIGVMVSSDLATALREMRPDIAVVSTNSALEKVAATIETCLAAWVAVVSTTEELAFPWRERPELARRIDSAARAAGRAVLGTGVNPGFAMDALPLALSAVCERVDGVIVRRIQDASKRRLPFQHKIGAGLSVEEFHAKVAAGGVRHVGLAESIGMLASAFGWNLDSVTDEIWPKIATERVASPDLVVAPGHCSGVVQLGLGMEAGTVRVRLEFEAYLGAPESYDEVEIAGSPALKSRVVGGIPGDLATASIVVNAIPRVLAAPPGLITMRDLPPAHWWPGTPTAPRPGVAAASPRSI
ncbi:MAG TPA: dihydrodipicolinate reductase [Thermoanaerobaculia bacterium]|jgi:4-hydroxy-tetrahydrodipicolinate reductase|nr:dihydrodipicolinate reductase [Thermoanaerobaculia bacterium]